METQVGRRSATRPLNAEGVLAFVLEVALLGTAGLWALKVLPLPPLAAWGVAVLPLVVLWGLFLAPAAPFRIRRPAHPVIAHGLFAAGSALLQVVDRPVLGWIMLALTVVSGFLAWRGGGWRADDAAPGPRGRPGSAQAPGGRQAGGRRAGARRAAR